eukprot:EG_transcript_14245
MRCLLAVVLAVAAVVAGGPDDIPIPVLGVPAFLNTGLLVRLLDSIDYPVDKVVLVHNGNHKALASLMDELRAKHPEYVILRHPENLGCAGSWNAIIDVNPQAPYYVITNDDILFRPGMLRTFAAAARQQVERVARGESNRVVVFPAVENVPIARAVWSCYALLRHAVARVGKFDANLWPAYHEDYDYAVRLSRAGLWHMQVLEAKIFHGVKGTRMMGGLKRAVIHQKKDPAVQLYKQQQDRHRRGAPYYALKWQVGWVPGILDDVEGYWNKTCNQTDTGVVCQPAQSRHYEYPFNDPSLPLSVFIFDPVFRSCLRDGINPPCYYNWSLLPHPELIPHGYYDRPSCSWKRNPPPLGTITLAPKPTTQLPRKSLP